MVKVRAKRMVYVNHRRYKEGEVFFVEDKQFSKVSMEKVEKRGRAEVLEEPEVEENAVANSDDEVI